MKIGEAVQQGEVYIKRIAELPQGFEGKAIKRGEKGFILSHSESGNHHLLSVSDGEVLERPPREGMELFYAILKNPEKVIQDAARPHGTHDLPTGIYDIRISREFDPFTGQARQVMD